MIATSSPDAPSTRAAAVRILREILDRLGPTLDPDRGQASQQLAQAIGEAMPDFPASVVLEAIEVVTCDEAAGAEEEALEDASLARAVDLCSRHGIGPDVPLGEALATIAGRGDPEAAAILAIVDGPEARLERALLDAAVDAHPAWTRVADGYDLDEAAGGPEFGPALVDWFQRTHPRAAAAIEAQHRGDAR